MTLSTLIRGKRNSCEVATAIPAISATDGQERARTVARIATIAVANRMEAKPATPAPIVGAGGTAADFDREWFEERAAILEFDAGYPRLMAERLAYMEVTLWQRKLAWQTLQ